MNVWLRSFVASARMLAVATALLGVGYAGFGLFVGLVLPYQANGSLVEVDGEVVGSALVGQLYEGDEWFHSRPSASDYDALASGASNLGPNNPDLVATIEARIEEVAAREGVDAADVPADAVTASGSGLDPHISPAYAELQVPRVAAAWGISEEEVRAMVADATSSRVLWVIGEDVVNVVLLNAALAAQE